MISYFVRRSNNEDANCNFVLEVGKNLVIRYADFEKVFGSLTSLEEDLLLLSASVFAADRATKRGEREDIARRIELQIPVVNSLRLQPLTIKIEEVLRHLSNDAWRIKFRQVPGAPEKDVKFTEGNGRTLLFSGGLDSLAAAIEFGEQDKMLQLVSHKTRNQITDQAQKKLVTSLKNHGLDLPHHQFFVSSRDGGPSGLKHAEESSQRTRSFLFLVLGALAARRAGHHEVVYLAENGQMAIHLPLTQARIGAFSTHTAHPDILVGMEEFLSSALSVPFNISNPYVHLTKAEVVKKVIDVSKDIILIANSCWRSARIPKDFTHCGECIPCFIRRIAIEFSMSEDLTAYYKDCWIEDIGRLGPEDIGRRNIVDLTEFIVQIDELSPEDIMSKWPDLYSLNFDENEVIAMYKRFSKEARTVLNRYSALAPYLL
ncbi:MAG: 7-cyano-7-deazaguanine synthase [Candidatus Poribacteria bacterium]|nr:7-cyano-7-deazaguanine synthase [Candidatus Poribacteria bacterium]